jgi:hypothetical protein
MRVQDKTLNKRIMFWVGSITAILTLIFAVQQVYTQITSSIKAKEEVQTLIESSQIKLESLDYAQAWDILSQADQYKVMQDDVESIKVKIGMLWLQNIVAGGTLGTFTEQVKRVTPVLDRVAIKAEGEYRADIYAHLGWADFLRQRDGNIGLNPDKYYEMALAVDPGNTYANTMLGHWLFSNYTSKRNYEKGWQHLQAAAKTGKHIKYVRNMQFAALRNEGSGNIKFLSLLHDMKLNGETIEDSILNKILISNYVGSGFDRFKDTMRTGKPVETSIALEDDLALIEWVWQEYPHLVEKYQKYRPYIVAILTESIGGRTAAHSMYKELQAGLPGNNLPARFKMDKYIQKALDRTNTVH